MGRTPPPPPCSPRRTAAVAALLAAFLGALLTACGGAGGGTGPATPAPGGETALVAAVAARLALAVDVAEAKWTTGAPIEDLAREAEAVGAIEAAARRVGVDPAVAAAALRAQIEASKLVQHALHARWSDEGRGPFDPVRDLRHEIRPELDVATAALLEALATVALPLPDDRVEGHAATVRGGLVEVPEPAAGAAADEALRPFR